METIKVLLADDHFIVRDGIRAMLNNYSEVEIVAEVSNGNELVQYLSNNSNTVDLVLTDLSMPDMDGIEATKIILERFPKIRVLVFSMHTEDTYITKTIKAGAHGYVLKSSSSRELVNAIKTIYRKEKYYSPEVSSIMIDILMNKSNTSELSKREIEVLGFIADGNTNKEAGKKLFLSSRTIETHRRNIMDKLNLRNTAEIVKYAIKNDYVI